MLDRSSMVNSRTPVRKRSDAKKCHIMLCRFVVREGKGRPCSSFTAHPPSFSSVGFSASRTVFGSVQQPREKLLAFGWGYMDKKLGVGRTGGVGEAGRDWGRVALHLRDRLADLAVCLPGGFLAGLVAVVCVFAARAAQLGGLTGASVASYIMPLAGVHLDLVGLEHVLQAPVGWAGCLATGRN